MLREYTLHLGEEDVIVEIIRSNRKTLSLEICRGCVKARIPRRLSDKRALEFVEQHREWVAKKLRRERERYSQGMAQQYPMPEFAELDAEEKKAVREAFLKRVAAYAARMDVSYGRISVKNQKTRWGSCSSKGNLNFNYRLYFLPREWMDYVVVHELAHRVHMNHSPAFWALVETYCPAYKTCRAELKKLML